MRFGVWVAIALIACGPTAAEIKSARDTTYEATPQEVFALAEQETAASYKVGERLPDELVFATQPEWFTDHGRQSDASEAEHKQAGNMQVTFAVLVIPDGAGAKVTVSATAIDYTPDKPEPKQLDDSKLPKWIKDRADKLLVLIHKRVQAMIASRSAKK